ncbi:pyridoxamine 5'-phosphate oxidase family protein [Listeria innocua]|uniref:pyridoxamine 5'-phosphate oxidase family protein n=1 Tax=Listeria innocua TaxID=1642 RepID=UPI001627C2CE|nr:pyridoxamine 5'-phosphate oxidase family protein [Listeria innocua]
MFYRVTHLRKNYFCFRCFFFSSVRLKVQQFLANPKAYLYFCDEENFQGITLIGEMEVLLEEEEKRSFWKDEYRMYYANGEDLSDFAVLKFNRISGNYYHDFIVEYI